MAMTIDKAIKRLSDPSFGCRWPTPRYEIEATKLGIEALIFSKNVLKLMPIVFALPLPGETKD